MAQLSVHFSDFAARRSVKFPDLPNLFLGLADEIAGMTTTPTFDATDLLGSFLSAQSAFLEQNPAVAANTVLVSQEYIERINAAPYDLVTNGAFGGLRVIVAEIGVPFLLAYIPAATVRAAQAG